MTIVNKRNAILGWGVWQVAKRKARQKARQVTKTPETKRGRGGAAGAIVSSLAAVGGTLWFWRRRRGGDEKT